MIPKDELLSVDRDFVLQNNDSSSLSSSTAVYASDWTNKQFKKAGAASSSPGAFFGLIHYSSTNTQGGLIQSSISVSDWAKIVTNGKTMHNYQSRVESTWSAGDTLYLAMGSGEDGKLTSKPSSPEEFIEVGKCLADAGASVDALIELTYWKSTLRTTTAAADENAVPITIITGDGGPGTGGTGGIGGNITAVSGTGGTGSTTAGAGGSISIESGDGGSSGSGAGGDSGDILLQPGTGGASTSGAAGDGGDLTLGAGAGGYHATASNSYTPGSAGGLNINGGDGGLGSTTQQGADGGNVTITGGSGGTDRGAGDGDGGDVVIDGGVGDTNGIVSLGATNASVISSGSGSTVWTHSGDLTVTGIIDRSYGEMYISGNSTATTLSQTPTYTRVTSTYNAGLVNDFTLTNGSGGSSGALRYDGTTTRTFKIVVSISSGASSADTIYFRIAKNGTTEAKSESHRYMSASNDEGSSIVTCIISLAQNDYVEIFASRAGATANITVDYMNFNISTV